MNIEQITGLILAGGRGTRMGHVDKGLQNFRGAPMALHVMLRLQPQVGEVMINANQNLAPYESFGVPVWPDEMQGHAGPLAGMQTGLIHCTTDYMVSAPCDSPFLPADLVQRLADGLLDADADLAVAVTGVGATRQVHPVFCLMKASLLQHLTEYLRDGGRKIDAWTALLNSVEVAFEDEAAFRNINTMAELKAYEPAPGQQ
nr:molybdenum cofactor guanylyltransferase MobA [uncultured Noviherbaspirillum sp.]